MEGYISEKEQIESIKKWWKETGKYIVIAVMIGLAIGGAWRYWHRAERHLSENASAIYQSVLVADANKQIPTAQNGIKILKKDFSGTPYASLAALLSAKIWVSAKQFPQALDELQWVIAHHQEPRLTELARIDAARILLAENKNQDALKELNTVNDKAFEPMIDWVRGDIYAAQKNQTQSMQYYQAAYRGFSDVPNAAALLKIQLAQ